MDKKRNKDNLDYVFDKDGNSGLLCDGSSYSHKAFSKKFIKTFYKNRTQSLWDRFKIFKKRKKDNFILPDLRKEI